MPLRSSWLYKLRTGKRMGSEPGSGRRTVQEVVPCSCSMPNRASYYVPTGDRRAAILPLLSPGKGNPKLPHPSDIVFDVVPVGDGRFELPEVKLRPIVTRPVGSDSADASPTSRARRRRRRWLYESLVVVKDSADPEEDFLESMEEMIAAAAALRSQGGLEELLACYLALNAAEHHGAIVGAFRRVCRLVVKPSRLQAAAQG